jgi:hypothetical protein|nr:uncharacterized protein LOC127310306 [Lolium perenne]
MENEQASWKKRSRRSPRDAPPSASAVRPGGHSEAFDDLIELVASFNEHQLALARTTPFAVFSEWTNKIRFDLNFSKWLVTHVDFIDRCILTGREFNIPVDARCATRIIGLPSSGVDIISGDISQREAGRLTVREFLGIKVNDAPSMTAAKNVLLRHREKPDSDDDIIFKAAFVVYVMAFLTGSYEVDGSQDDQFWHAVDGSTPIDSFNWGAYLVNSFVQLCSKSATSIKSGISKLPPPGCNLFFQVTH